MAAFPCDVDAQTVGFVVVGDEGKAEVIVGGDKR